MPRCFPSPGQRALCGKAASAQNAWRSLRRIFSGIFKLGNPWHKPALARYAGCGCTRMHSYRNHLPSPDMTSLSQRLTKSESPLRIHLIGVAGSGMSGLALLLIGMGTMSADRKSDHGGNRTHARHRTVISTPHTTEAVHGVDFVVYSSAIRPENPALRPPATQASRCYAAAECLAAILRTKKGVVVAGPWQNHNIFHDRPRVARNRYEPKLLRRRGNPRYSVSTRAGPKTANI